MIARKLIFLLVIALFYTPLCDAQSKQITGMPYNGAKYDVYIVRVDSLLTNRFQILENKNGESDDAVMKNLSKNGSFFLCNAGLSDSTCNFLGLYIKNNQKMADINLSSGSGNFYLKPNGFVAIDDQGVEISQSENYDYQMRYRWGVQNGPMLISANSINPQFNPNSPNKNIRLGIGVFSQSGDKYLVFACSKTPVTFHQFASLFQAKFNCMNALNLTSGDVSMLHLPNAKLSGTKGKTTCNYFYIPLK